MEEKIKLGISSCLLGEPVRYDGGHKLDHFLRDTLGRFLEWVPICPEVECGLPVPRESMRLVGDPDSPRLITVRSGVDHTKRMTEWAAEKVKELEGRNLCGFVFKTRSPSSGMRGVKVYTTSGMPGRTGSGLFAAQFMSNFPLLPVEDEGRLHDMKIRENFIERVFVYHRWHTLAAEGLTPGKLVEFHTRHKYLIMAHSPEHLRRLGRLVAEGRGRRGLYAEYLEVLMDGLKRTATIRKNVNVLQHIMGYFKNILAADEKQEILELISRYHKGYVPLVVPLVLLQHYVRKYDEPYLNDQVYLSPHPVELMLRNHV